MARIGCVAHVSLSTSLRWTVIPSAVLALGMAGWMAPASSAPVPRAVELRVAAPVPHAHPESEADPLGLARLAAYRDKAIAPEVLGRSPFEFDLPRAAPSPHTRAAGDAQQTLRSAPVQVVPTDARPVLLGIAEQDGPDGVVRTAVLTDPDGTVRFAVIGQAVGDVFRVSAIESDRVVLVHATTGRASELVLR